MPRTKATLRRLAYNLRILFGWWICALARFVMPFPVIFKTYPEIDKRRFNSEVRARLAEEEGRKDG